MSQFEKTGQIITDGADSLMSGKPIWFWWAGYILLTAVLFAIFYFTLYILTVRLWVIVLLVAVIGFVWGTIAFTNRKSVKK